MKIIIEKHKSGGFKIENASGTWKWKATMGGQLIAIAEDIVSLAQIIDVVIQGNADPKNSTREKR